MKKTAIIAIILSFIMPFCACSKDDNGPAGNPSGEGSQAPGSTDSIGNKKLIITIGETVLTATLYDNATAKDFISLLPLTLNLDDYNNTEKNQLSA